MNKYQRVLELLEDGKQAEMKVFGNSMLPIIKSGSKLTFEKMDKYDIGDIVFCKVSGRWIDAHKITKVNEKRGYMIANNAGHENGWTKRIFGKVVKIE
jgi:hypothetical protein